MMDLINSLTLFEANNFTRRAGPSGELLGPPLSMEQHQLIYSYSAVKPI